MCVKTTLESLVSLFPAKQSFYLATARLCTTEHLEIYEHNLKRALLVSKTHQNSLSWL